MQSVTVLTRVIKEPESPTHRVKDARDNRHGEH
jgi:hypothetical protein